MKAIILYGPSGAGKTTLANSIKKLNYKHCNTNIFMEIYSQKRSKNRSKIAQYLAFHFALQLIENKENMILESLGDAYIVKVKKILKKNGYQITEISLVASLKSCIRNDEKRKNSFGPEVIKMVHSKYSKQIGFVINTDNKTEKQVFNSVIHLI